MTISFAALDPSTPAIIGAFGVMLAGFFAISTKMLAQASKDREADREERLHLTQAIEHMAKSSNRVAEATTKSAKEAKERNGHLGDQNMKLADLITAQAKDISIMKETTQKNLQANVKVANTLSKSAIIAAEDRDALVNNTQVISEQHVAHQVIENNNDHS